MKASLLRYIGAMSLAIGTFGPLSGVCSAQTTAPAVASNQAPDAREQKHMRMVERRIGELRTALDITPSQAQQWEAFAQTMRDNAQTGAQALQERASQQQTETADAAMTGYARLARQHADDMQRLATSFSTLYVSLNAQQKSAADELFRNPGWNRVGKRKTHHGTQDAPGAAKQPGADAAQD